MPLTNSWYAAVAPAYVPTLVELAKLLPNLQQVHAGNKPTTPWYSVPTWIEKSMQKDRSSPASMGYESQMKTEQGGGGGGGLGGGGAGGGEGGDAGGGGQGGTCVDGGAQLEAKLTLSVQVSPQCWKVCVASTGFWKRL